MTNRQKSRAAWAGVGGSVLLSLWLRVFYSWPYVFTSRGVDFQEPDAWFHVRTARNLLAHFPFRSGFDPYALFPGGMNVPTGPLWEYMVASAAWIAGLGSPSSALTDHVAAWLPAILGALCPIPAFWLARRLFGLTAGLFAALWIAAGGGEFLTLTYLGNADHHAAEGFFSLLVFSFLCAAVDSRTWRWLAILAGVSMGALFATQPAAVFVPGVLVAAAMLAPSLAPAVLYCCGTAALIMLAVAETPYTGYDWLSLVGGAAAAAAIWLLDALHQRRSWPSRWRAPVRWLAAAIVLALGFGVTELLRPALVPSMLAGLSALNASEVAELQPIVKASQTLQSNFSAMNLHLGVSWMAALPGLIAVAVVALRKRQASLTLFTVAAAAFVVAAFLHIRMILYWAPFGAILAGAVCAWATGFAANRFALKLEYRFTLAAVLAVALLAGSLPGAILRMSSPAGAGQDWIEALTWLRDHSPEPFGDSAVWNGYFLRRKPGQSASLRAPSYGVAVWWDFGYLVEKLSHRIPIMNGFGAGTDDKAAVEARRGLAASLAGTFVDPAVDGLRKLGARYVIVDSRLPLGPGIASRTVLTAMQRAAGYPTENSVLVLWYQDKGADHPVPIYLEDYYRSVGERLYLYDGQAVHGAGPWVLGLKKGSGGHAVITGSRHFDDAREAGEYMAAHTGESLVIGCLDRVVSCFDVEAVRGMHRVFTSDPLPISPDRVIRAVKIFEVEPDPALQSR